MATSTKKKSKSKSKKHAGGYSRSSYKKNPGHHGVQHHHKKYKKNPSGASMSGGIGGLVTNAVFVIVGALGSKLATQAVLGTNNVGVIGYGANAVVGAILWFITEKLMKNRAASSGVISGTLVQILLRVINDYTPFGAYVAQLGMGDYQMQSFVTPQVLVDPWNSAEIQIPPGWQPRMLPGASPAAVAAPAGGGMSMTQSKVPAGTPMPNVAGGGGRAGGGVSGLYGAGGWGGGLYSA